MGLTRQEPAARRQVWINASYHSNPIFDTSHRLLVLGCGISSYGVRRCAGRAKQDCRWDGFFSSTCKWCAIGCLPSSRPTLKGLCMLCIFTSLTCIAKRISAIYTPSNRPFWYLAVNQLHVDRPRTRYSSNARISAPATPSSADPAS